MNIGVNTRMLIKDRMEGIARYTYETVRRIVKTHPEHQFYFFFDRTYDASFVFADNVVPVVLSPPARHPFLWYVYFEYAIANALNKYEVDVFYSPDNYLSLRSKTPTLLVTHDIAYAHFSEHVPLLPRAYYNYFMPKYNKKADHIIAVSHATKRDLIQTYNITESKISVAHNSCPAGFQKATLQLKTEVRTKYANGKPYIIYAGAIHPRKNVDSIIRAYNTYKAKANDETQLVLAGRWAWKTQGTRDLIENSPYKEEIHIHVNANFTEVLPGAEAALYISLYEGFGIPVLEGMQAEVPVITSNLSSMPEVAGEAAVLVDPMNIEEIASAIDIVLNDNGIATQLKQRGLLQVQQFSWDDSASHIYDKLMSIV